MAEEAADAMKGLISTLHEHHEHILHRLDFQDDLLKRLSSCGVTASPLSTPVAKNRLSPRIDIPAGPLPPALTPANTQVDPEMASNNVAVSISLSAVSPRSDLVDLTQKYRVSESSSLSPQGALRSYTEEDMELREGADLAESRGLRKRFSDRPEEIPTGSATKRLQDAYVPWATRIVHNGLFDLVFAFIVMANAIYIGFDIQRVLDGEEVRPLHFSILHYVFSTFFLAELLLRLADSRCRYYCSEDWAWAILDTLIVATSWWDIFVDLMEFLLQDDRWEGISGLSTLKAMRIVRLTRVLKTAHFLRIFRFIMALRMLVQSILHTVKALFWALLLLGLIVYVFAILFSQAVFDYISDEANPPLPPDVQDRCARYFGTLLRSMLAMFMSITGGVSWEEVIIPLTYVSAFWEMLFLFYIAFSYLAVLNVVTAVFCQSAIESAQNDHATVVQNMLDNKEAHLQKLRTLFSKIGESQERGITYRMFEEKINSPAVREYFETLGLDVWDSWSFFKLLDSDGGGVVELEEFFLGCLRFSGEATAMEVGRVAADQKWLIRSQGRFQKFVEEEFLKARSDIAGLADVVSIVSQGVSTARL